MKAGRPRVKLLALALSMFLLAAPGFAEEIWIEPVFPAGVNSTSFLWSVTGGGYTFFSFGVPDDMESFKSARIVLLPESSSAAAETYQVLIEVKRNGEVVSTEDWSLDTNTETTVDDTLLEIDISTQLEAELNVTSPGNDIVSVFFRFSGPGTADTDGRAVGMRFAYDSIHRPDVNTVSSATVINDSLTQDDLATNSVGPAELAPDSVLGQEIVDGSVSGIDILNNSIAGVDIGLDTITAANIAIGGVGSAEILDGSVNSDDIQNSSILDVDILDEAGADLEGGDQSVSLTATDVIVRTITITAPTSGRIIVNASGYFNYGDLPSPIPDVGRCSITPGAALDFAYLIIAEDRNNATRFGPFGATRGFVVGSGARTFNLVCDEFSGNVAVDDTFLTAIFVPTEY